MLADPVLYKHPIGWFAQPSWLRSDRTKCEDLSQEGSPDVLTIDEPLKPSRRSPSHRVLARNLDAIVSELLLGPNALRKMLLSVLAELI